MDDGIRQVSISALLALNPEQFQTLDLKLGGIHGAVDKLAENIAEPDTSVAAEIASLKEMVGVGFNDVRQSITDLNNTIFDASNNLGKWLAAIALAASTPDDNSKEVQEQINKHAAEINAVRETLQSSINRNQPEGA